MQKWFCKCPDGGKLHRVHVWVRLGKDNHQLELDIFIIKVMIFCVIDIVN